jgi:diaminohydroxyphosphoribosylaminopyrimidine deaminase/5-amino-6-(5-phosphoribosylamino)uracil reductase
VNPELSSSDTVHLEWARRIATEGWGQVQPNPMVGCVLVRDGLVVGQGYHEVFGGPHAEIVALEDALGQAEGATAYVSLEPCNHDGKTPPCSEALIAAGVVRVVYGAADPGGASGGGGDTLRAAGLDVVGPAWSSELSRTENPAFFHAAVHDSPFVALKLAMTMDAKIAASPGSRTRITGAEAEREVHRLRAGFDAIMIGGGTMRADDPQLTPRMVASGRTATRRVILASDAKMPSDAALFRDVESAPIHLFSRNEAQDDDLEILEGAGVQVHVVAASEGGVDLPAVLGVCWEVGIRSILCEGGATLAANLLRERLVHRVYLFISPKTFGDAAVAAFPSDAGTLDWEDFRPAGPPVRYGADTLMVLDRQEG